MTKPTGESPKQDTGDHPDKEEGWTQVQRGGKKKKSPVKTSDSEALIAATSADTVTTVTTTTTKKAAAASPSTTTKKIKEKTKEKTKEIEAMDYSINLKRRRDSGDSITEEGGKNI